MKKPLIEKSIKNRFEIVDQLKAIAVILMVLFHLAYDLSLFSFIDIDKKHISFWIWPKVIITIFLVCMGINLRVMHLQKIRWTGLIKRVKKLGILAIIISVVTYVVFPNNWIYFGILHFITFASIISLPFMKFPKISLLLGVIFILPSILYRYVYPFISLSTAAVDLVPPLPWMGMVFIGFFLQSVGFEKISVPDYPGKKYVGLLGKYSLEIYITHQAILFPIIYLLSLIRK